MAFDPKASKAELITSTSTPKEGGVLTTTINTKNVKPGTTLFWTLSGAGINSADFSKGTLSGSNLVDATGSFSFSHTLSADTVKEGTEQLNIALFSDKSLSNPVAKTSVSITDSPQQPAPVVHFNQTQTPKIITEGDTLILRGFGKNVQPGTTLYWGLNSQTSDATIQDFKKFAPKAQEGFTTTIDNNGKFEITLASLHDQIDEESELFQIDIYLSQAKENSLATSELITLIDSKKENNIKTNLELPSHVIPARFANEAIPVQKLINFRGHHKEATFNFNNSNIGGYFEYQKAKYQGTEILDVPASKLSQLYYVPTAPEGHYDTSQLRTITTETPTETFKPKGGDSKLVKQESLEIVQQRQNPFNPLTSIGKQFNPSIRDQISVSVNTPNGRSQPARAEWITRGNWKPEITVLQSEFTTQRGINTGISITDILDIHDIDGDKIKNIQIKDISNAKQSGYFEYKKEIYQGRDLPLINEADLGLVTYHPGQGGINNIEVSASDELNGKSRIIKAGLKTKEAPKATLANPRQTFDSADIGKPIPLKNLINISTMEADDTNTYKLDLKSKSKKDEALGYFSLLGKRLKPEQLTGLNQETVRDIQFMPTNNKIRSNFTLEATDQSGKTITSSSAWKSTKNQKPTLNVKPVQLDSSQANKQITISNLINAKDDSDSITSYTLKSVKGKGSFRFNGKTYSNQTLTVGAEDLELISYLAPGLGQSDQIKVTASDGKKESKPAFMNWSIGSIMEPGSVTQSFNIGIDEEWKIGDFLGVQNEQTYSKFFGMDKTISNRNFNAGIGIAGVKFKTGDTKMKAGLQLEAGYGLGSLSLQGGLSASATLDENGLTFEGTSSDPTLDFELPYAYLGLDAVGEFKYAPSLKFWYDVWLADGQTSNLLSFLNTNVNVSNSLIDLDTRHITGSNYTKSFNIGAFSANASLPNFGNVSELNQIPSTFQSDSTWSNGRGDGIAYGVSGSTTLLDLSLSLGQVASYFGLPLSINKSIWGGDLSITGTLADASIGIDAELNYGAKVAVKPNVYAQVEGLRPTKKYDILGDDTSLDFNSFRDTNNDGNISVTIEADPIIAANASVSIEGGVTAAAEVLSARARVNKWTINKTWNVGPLWEGGPWDLYSNEVSLIDMTRSYKLSDLAPNLQDQLSVTLELPVI